jgi:hypothetical protein
MLCSLASAALWLGIIVTFKTAEVQSALSQHIADVRRTERGGSEEERSILDVVRVNEMK